MRKLVVISCILALSVAVFAADNPVKKAATTAAPEVSKLEIFGGYSYMRVGSGVSSVSSQNTNGWEFGTSYNFNRYLAATADFNGGYAGNFFKVRGVDGKVYNFLFGPTFTYRNKSKMTPFAHALFGVNRLTASASVAGATVSSSDNAFGMALGGGMDYKINKMFSARVGQFDYMRSDHSNASQNHFRYSAGMVIKPF